MIPRPEWRVLAYLLCWAAATWVVVQRMLSYSQAAYDGGDLSAFAWTGFFPFFFPLFIMEAGFYLLPFVILVEIVLFCVWYWG